MRIGKLLNVSVRLIVVSIIIFSLVYPFLVGGIGQIWGSKISGSLIKYKSEVIGSRLIGQNFSSPYYFHSRPSSIDYDAGQSGSANLAPNNPEIRQRVKNRLEKLATRGYLKISDIPASFVTESGSALDPHLSPESALMQVPRIAAVTGISEARLNDIIRGNIKPQLLGLYGMKRVNVLELNLAIEEVLDNE